MLVSVIIPNYNHAKFLNERIDSILNQTDKNLELIILDDCSTDESRDIIESYKGHPQVSHIIFNDVNSGSVFKQWEKGIRHAKGEYVWIAESDDYAAPELIETLIPHLEANPNLGLAYADSSIVFEDGDLDPQTFAAHRKEWLNSNKWEYSYTNDGRKEIAENLLDMCTINNASSVIFRKDALLSINPFDLELRYTGDWYIYLKICMKYDLCYINKPLSFYREHASNSFKKSRAGVRFVREYFLIFDWIYRNVDFVPKSKILRLFLGHTRHTLLRNWSIDRIKLYMSLLKRNKVLFLNMLQHNMTEPFRRRGQ